MEEPQQNTRFGAEIFKKTDIARRSIAETLAFAYHHVYEHALVALSASGCNIVFVRELSDSLNSEKRQD